MKRSPAYVARHIRVILKNGGSAPHSIAVQRFFKEEIKSRGWYTHELRKVAARFRRNILADGGQAFLVQVADLLFRGEIHEEKSFAVMLLQGLVKDFGMPEFRLFESWMDHITNWAEHDGLIHYLIGPMIAIDPSLLDRPIRWAKKRSRWHKRAAAVSLIHSTRQHKNFKHIRIVTELLFASDDDMVQKGLGWLLREAAKANPEQTVAYLMTIRDRMPRRVLRTACETLSNAARNCVLIRA